ncbi:MAG TPA: 30S ribosomal protein S8 [Nitrospiria bacterium]|nr:30S ribosomal protein S8 [Nitrospiria bacterium]
MTDPIADMLIRITNALQRRYQTVEVPQSRLNMQIAAVLRDEGFVEAVNVTPGKPRAMMNIRLKYLADEEPVIHGLKRVSRPGRRVYSGYQDLKPIEGGIGIMILSTPAGVLTDHQSRQRRVGGEVLCQVW